MKSYLDQRGVYHRTQADAKASGFPFEMVDIPTDHAGLIDFVNRLSVPVPPPVMVDQIHDEQQWVCAPGAAAAFMVKAAEDMGLYDGRANEVKASFREPERGYQNGDPTTPFMGSRDPRAVFTCRNCGKDNSNG